MGTPKGLSLGIDIGGSSVKAALIAPDRTLLGRSSPYDRPDHQRIVESIAEAVAPLNLRGDHLAALGVCLPGLYEPSLGSVTKSFNVPGIVGVPVHELVSRSLPIPAPTPAIIPDALATAFDIWATGTRSGRLLVLALGTGVGAAVLDDGLPLRVNGLSPGHIGQIDVSVESDPSLVPVGPDGGRGGLEAYVGLPALRARFGPQVGRLALGPGDPILLALSRALRICHAIYRPQHIVLAGGVGLALEDHIEAIRALVSSGLTGLARPGWSLGVGQHAHHAACGAARWALSQSA